MTIQLGTTLFLGVVLVYLAAAASYLVELTRQRPQAGKTGSIVLMGGLLLHTGALVVRALMAHRPPFLNLYEYMSAFTWGTGVVYLTVEATTRKRVYGAFIVPLIALLALLTWLLPGDVNPTMPALRSAWRIPHIASAILAYGAFAGAFMLAVMYLFAEKSRQSERSFWAPRLPALPSIDLAIYQTVAFGFLMQTLVIIVGAIWAQAAWGRFWGWDPKETWSLVTWLIYAVYLHTRTAMGWSGTRSAVVAVTGFLVTIFTLFGVNFIHSMAGLHSYAR